MLPIPIKFYAYLGIVAIAVGGFFYVKHVFNDRDKLKESNKELTRSLDAAIAGAFLYQENNERQVKLISDYQVKLDEKQSKNTQLERDVANGVKQLRIHGASCPKSSSTTSANTVEPETAPIISADLRSNIFRIRSGIITLEENYALCLKVLDEDRRQKNTPPKLGKGPRGESSKTWRCDRKLED